MREPPGMDPGRRKGGTMGTESFKELSCDGWRSRPA